MSRVTLHSLISLSLSSFSNSRFVYFKIVLSFFAVMRIHDFALFSVLSINHTLDYNDI